MPRTFLSSIFLKTALILPITVTATYADFDRGLEPYQSGDAAGAAQDWKLDAENGRAHV